MFPPCQSVPPHLPSMSFSRYFTYHMPYFLLAWKVSTPVNSRRFVSDSQLPPITLWDLHALHQHTGMTPCYHKIITYNQFTNFHSTYRPSNTVTLIFTKILTGTLYETVPCYLITVWINQTCGKISCAYIRVRVPLGHRSWVYITRKLPRNSSSNKISRKKITSTQYVQLQCLRQKSSLNTINTLT